MRYLDKNFQDNKRRFITQSVMAGAAIAVVLFFFDVVRHPMIIASLGASAFIAFTVPHAKISGPRYLIGGYIVGLAVGVVFHFATDLPIDHYMTQKFLHILASALAVGFAMFFMAITDTEHAPATSIALGLVLNEWTGSTIVLILLGISLISLIQRLLKPYMMDLL